MVELVHAIEDAQLIFKNFSGRESKWNAEGDRNFGVILQDEKVAEAMAADAWNVKWLEPLDEGDPPTPWLPVAVSFKYKPPKMFFLDENKEKGAPISEEVVGSLDYADIVFADIFIRGSRWEVNGKTGVKAYLQTMFVQIVKDPIEEKYSAY